MNSIILVDPQRRWAEHYRESVNRSMWHYELLNMIQPVWSRPMTEEEKEQIFGDNPDYIKNIGRDSDDKEWRLINDTD